MTKYIKVNEMLNRWKINEDTLVDIVRYSGLKVSDQNCRVPEYPASVIADELREFDFKLQDVEQFEKDHPELLSEKAPQKLKSILRVRSTLSDLKFVSFIDVMKRWEIGETEMIMLIFNKMCLKPYSFVGGLPAQLDIDHEREELLKSKEVHPPEKFHDWVFRLSNLEETERVFDFSGIHNETQFEKTPDLPGQEKRELGRLRTEKAKWDQSIRAAVHATIFAIEQKQPVIRDKLKDELYRTGFKDVPDTTFDKIWKAIPLEYRHKGGAPKKNT